jgi:hypothetical protein
MIKFDTETHPIRLVEQFEVTFKKPTALEMHGMEQVIQQFCYTYLDLHLLGGYIIHDYNSIRLKSPIVYQEILIESFKVTTDGHVIGIGSKEGEQYLLQLW